RRTRQIGHDVVPFFRQPALVEQIFHGVGHHVPRILIRISVTPRKRRAVGQFSLHATGCLPVVHTILPPRGRTCSGHPRLSRPLHRRARGRGRAKPGQGGIQRCATPACATPFGSP